MIKLYWQNIDINILLGSILCVKIVANLTQTQRIIYILWKEGPTQTLTRSISVHGIRSVLEVIFFYLFFFLNSCFLVLRGNFDCPDRRSVKLWLKGMSWYFSFLLRFDSKTAKSLFSFFPFLIKKPLKRSTATSFFFHNHFYTRIMNERLHTW